MRVCIAIGRKSRNLREPILAQRAGGEETRWVANRYCLPPTLDWHSQADSLSSPSLNGIFAIRLRTKVISEAIIGLAAAATCTTTFYVPQVVKAWCTKSTNDISVGMFLWLTVEAGIG